MPIKCGIYDLQKFDKFLLALHFHPFQVFHNDAHCLLFICMIYRMYIYLYAYPMVKSVFATWSPEYSF